MMTNQDGMRIRVANDAYGINTHHVIMTVLFFPQLWSSTEQKLVTSEEVTQNKPNQ